RLWDPTTGASRSTLRGHSSWVSAVAFSRDGQLLASVSDDKTVRLWDPTTRESSRTLERHSVMVRAAAFSHDCQLLASASIDKTVRLWDIKTRESIQELNPGDLISKLSFTSDGSHLVTDRGILELKLPTLCELQFQLNSSPYLYVNQYWVTCKKGYVLWLPPD